MESYKAFSEKKGVEFKPSETYINFILKFIKENKLPNENTFLQLK